MTNEGEWREVWEPNLDMRPELGFRRKFPPPDINFGHRKCHICQNPATHTNGLGVWACKEHAHD